MIELTRLKHIRKGQQLFTFLWWLKNIKHVEYLGQDCGVVANTFYMPDEEFDKLYEEFLEWPGNREKELAQDKNKLPREA